MVQAKNTASRKDCGSAMFFPAISKAVPCTGDVLTILRPEVT